jgi:hypothetical protein
VPKSDEASLRDWSIGTTAAMEAESPLLLPEEAPLTDCVCTNGFAATVDADVEAGGVNGAANEFAKVVNALARASLALDVDDDDAEDDEEGAASGTPIWTNGFEPGRLPAPGTEPNGGQWHYM